MGCHWDKAVAAAVGLSRTSETVIMKAMEYWNIGVLSGEAILRHSIIPTNQADRVAV
jgi:hypothetical protein